MRSAPVPLSAILRQLAHRLARAVHLEPAAGANMPDVSMDDEMRYHIECDATARMDRGVKPVEARRLAAVAFGGVQRHQEEARDTRSVRVVEDAMRDVRYGMRVLRRNPGFATIVVLTFALGIGCTSAIFSLVNGILLAPLPYELPDGLVSLWERNAERGGDPNVVSVATLEAWRARSRAFVHIAGLVPHPLTLDGSPAERLTGVEVSPEYFRMLGVHPALGRDFDSAAVARGETQTTILSDALWRSRFGADPTVIGRSISVDGQPMLVIGVMAPNFDAPRFGWIAEQPLWLPFAATQDKRSWGRFLHVIARLAPGTTIEQARGEMLALSAALAAEIPDDKGWSSSVIQLSETIAGDVRRPLLVSFAAVVLLLLMSMVNVASLMTGFLRRRSHELAMRRAVGATAGRIVRQQIVLSTLLGAVGAAIGLLLAIAGTRVLVALSPPSVPRLAEVVVDRNVVLFAVAISLATVIIVGVVGVLLSTRDANTAGTLASSGSGRASTRQRGSRLVVTEVAIGLVLTLLAALMVRSLVNLRAVKLGFEAESLIAGRVSLPSASYPNDSARHAFFSELVTRARAFHGVTGASLVTTRPFACCAPATTVMDPERSMSEASAPIADVRYADDSYFATARIPVLSGHVFDETERADGQPHVVVSRSLARTLWSGGDPVGKTLALHLNGTTMAMVIGVVGDVTLADPHSPTRPSAYLSTERYPSTDRDIVVRGTGDMQQLLEALRAALASVDPTVPLYMATSLQSSVGETLAQDRFTTILLSAFAVVAMLLAAVGVYGVLSGDVTRRRKEMGIRLALGSPRATVTTLVLNRALWLAAAGAAIGIVFALAIARSMSALLFGIASWDPLSFTVVTVVLLFVAAMAALVPALRAARASPIEAIRAD